MNDDTSSTLSALAQSPKPLPSFSRARDGFSRNQVVDAFQTAFEMIGGVQRLVLWADENPGLFYRLYSKLLPATTIQLGETSAVQIMHALAPTALDRYTDEDRKRTLEGCIRELPQDVVVHMLAEVTRDGQDRQSV